MPFIDTPEGRFEGTAEQIDAYRKATRGISVITPTKKDDSPDTTTGADFMTRVGASFKMTPEGKRSFYADKFGAENVAVDEKSGEIMFREKKGGRFKMADESQISLRDLADFAGDVPGAVLSAIGGVMGATAGSVLPGAGTAVGGIAGAGTGAAVGNVIKQGVGAALPGAEKMTPLDRVGSVAGDMALGAGGQAVSSGMVGLRDLVRPGQAMRVIGGKAVARPDTAAVARASRETDIPLSTSEVTGSANLRALEDYSRRVPFVRDQYQAFDTLQREKAVERIKGIMTDLHADEMGSETYGVAAQRAFRKLTDDAVAARRSQAGKDFGEVERLAGKDVLLPVRGTKEAMLRLAEQFDAPGGGDATSKLVRQIRSAADEIGESISPSQFQRLLQIYGKAAAGKGTVFADLDSAQQRHLAKEVHKALTRDLDAAADVGTVVRNAGGKPPQASEVAAALKVARDNYAANSAKITQMSDSVLGDYFETAASRTPERVADRVRLMKPTEIRATLGLLREADPEIAEKTASFFLNNALSKATDANTPFSAAKFLKNLPPEPAQEALLGGKPALGEIRKVAQVLERVREKPAEGSQTGGRLLTALTMGGAGGFALAFPTTAATTAGSVYLTSNTIAKAMLTPKGREALLQVASSGPKTRGAVTAANYLAATQAAEQKAEVDAAIREAGAQPAAR